MIKQMPFLFQGIKPLKIQFICFIPFDILDCQTTKQKHGYLDSVYGYTYTVHFFFLHCSEVVAAVCVSLSKLDQELITV